MEFNPNPLKSPRTYFHSKNGEPFSPRRDSIDSEEDVDHSWLRKLQNDAIDDYDDVNEKDRQFMKSWNEFVHSKKHVCDTDILQICLDFVTAHRTELKKLYESMVTHLMVLWDNHTLTADQVYHVQMKMKLTLRNIET